MADEAQPDAARLDAAREHVHTFMIKKERFAKALWVVAGFFELLFFVLLLVFMDFDNREHWFFFFGFMMVYTPLITFMWRNAVKIDHMYYRLVEELKYGELPAG
jgi:L-asparagine transporter-like permease